MKPRPFPFVLAIIQARAGGLRFPGKVFEKVGGKSVLEHAIARVKDAERVHSTVVSTPDKRISDLADNRGVFGFWYRGDEQDVLSRFVKTAEWENSDIVVRITADSPLVPTELIDDTIASLENNDIASTVRDRTFPRGFDIEVFHRDVLYRLDRLVEDPALREHVTLFAYQNPELFRWSSVTQRRDFSAYDLSVDTPTDLEFVREVYELSKPDVSQESIIKALDEHF